MFCDTPQACTLPEELSSTMSPDSSEASFDTEANPEEFDENDEATITAANQYAKNGLLHVIDKMVPALPSAWGFLQADPAMPSKQKAFLLSIDSAFSRNVYDLRDEKKAVYLLCTGGYRMGF